MDVRDLNMEMASKQFNEVISISDNRVIHLAFSRINIDNNLVNTISTDYEWHLMYWDSGLYRNIGSRMRSGITEWTAYRDDNHNSLMAQRGIKYKTDYTQLSPDNQCVDILSVATSAPLLPAEQHHLASLRPALAFKADTIWKHCQTKPISLTQSIQSAPNTPHSLIQLSSDKDAFLFGDVCLSSKEMETIRQLLELKSIKEIAFFHHCSQQAERNRIEKIKAKFRCENRPLSHMFQQLKLYGVTEACLHHCTTYPSPASR